MPALMDRTIADDVEAGEALIPLGELPSHPFMPRNAKGKPYTRNGITRWTSRGLEFVGGRGTGSGRRCTTRSAVLRFLQKAATQQG